MPTLIKIGNISIRVFAHDHAPPHFHVYTPDNSAQISIATLEILNGQLTRGEYRTAREWASENIEQVKDAWNELNN
jgi:hypothetical protein